jgi:hypothetical protein
MADSFTAGNYNQILHLHIKEIKKVPMAINSVPGRSIKILSQIKPQNKHF